MLEPCAALLGAGHAVHLGLTAPAQAEALSALWQAQPGLTVGHAVPRRDVWVRLADRLDPEARLRLPPDPGVRVYLAQLDLDLLLLAAPRPGPLETDYLAAAAHLGLPAQTLAQTPEAVLAQAGPGAGPSPLRPRPTPTELWGRLVWSELTQPPQAGPSSAAEARGQAGGLWPGLQEAYARRVYPALASAIESLAPERRPLLKNSLRERLQRSVLDDEISAEAVMAAAGESPGTVVLGPWWGDADQELLYWAPFLDWWRRRYKVDKDRIVVVSSGRAGAWYEGVLGRYIDLAELYDPPALAELERGRGEEMRHRNKRFGGTAADREVLKRLNRRLGFRGVTAMPPWVMAVALDRYWSGQAGPAVLGSRTRPQSLKIKQKVARRLFPRLPDAYVCLDVSGAAAASPERRQALEALALRIARDHQTVVLAEPGDVAFAGSLIGGSKMQQMIELEPATRKQTASAVLAAARGFIGPPGWMAYAAANLDRPAVCVTSGREPRQLIDQGSADRLLARPPLWIDLAETEIAATALHRLVAGAH